MNLQLPKQLSPKGKDKQDAGYILISLLMLLVFFFISLFIFQGIAIAFLSAIYKYGPIEITNVISKPADYPDFRMGLLFLQGFSALGSMILAPYFYIKYYEGGKISQLNASGGGSFFLLILGIIIVFTTMPLNNILAQWNQQLEFPAFLEGFEKWAQSNENQLEKLTMYLTQYDNTAQFILGIIVIGAIPGIGEELVFRGILQRKFHDLFNNPHIAIWVTGALFSFIHFQFYGFLPRMLLGVLFGYLYFWSGNIIIPMACHFANNAFTLYMMHLYHQDIVDMNIHENPEIPVMAVFFSVFASAGLLYLFKNQGEKESGSNDVDLSSF